MPEHRPTSAVDLLHVPRRWIWLGAFVVVASVAAAVVITLTLTGN